MPKLLDRTGAVVSVADEPETTGRYATATPLDAIVADLPRLSAVIIEFTVFRDGRGFSLARALRERHGFTGEIRATGHIIADQFPLLLRCGFSQAEIPDDADPRHWTAALSTFSVAYQPGFGGPDSALSVERFASA